MLGGAGKVMSLLHELGASAAMFFVVSAKQMSTRYLGVQNSRGTPQGLFMLLLLELV